MKFFQNSKCFNLNFNSLDKFAKSVSTPLFLSFLIGILALSVQLYVQFMYIDIIPLYLILLNTFVLLLYLGLNFYNLFRNSRLESIAQDLEKEKLYNKTLTLLYDNIRCFRHDFNNTVQTIGGYLSTNNIDSLKNYYNGLLDDCQKVNVLSLLNPETINNPAIYSLLPAKYHKADELGIKINLDVFTSLENLNVKPYELTKILGILLDNAIEASSLCENKIINITFRKDKKIDRDLIIIENTYTNKEVNTDKIFEKGYSSKTNENKINHGLGLWEVRKILARNSNLNLFTTKDSEYFKQQLEIYN